MWGRSEEDEGGAAVVQRSPGRGAVMEGRRRAGVKRSADLGRSL